MKEKFFSSKRFSEGTMMVLYIMALRLIVDTFLDIYVSTAINRISNENNMLLIQYYIVKHIVMIFSAICVGPWIKISYKKMLQVGIATNMLFFLSFAFMTGNNMITFYITAILEGISMVLFYLPVEVLITMKVLPEERHRYSSRNSMISKILSLAIPVILGGIISGSSYLTASVCMFVVLTVQFLLIRLVKEEKNIKKDSYNLCKFFRNLPKDEKILFSAMTLCKGIALVGAQQQLINLLIFYKLGSEFSLGIATSAIGILAIVIMFGFEKLASEKLYKKLLIICLGIQIIATTWLVVNCNLESVLAIRVCFSTSVSIVSVIAENCMYNLIYNKKTKATEYVIYQEVLLNFGRILSWILTAVALISAGKSGNSFSIAIALLNIFFVIMVIVVYKLVKKLYK